MNTRIILAMIAKDAMLYARNRLFAFLTVVGIAAYVLVYLLMPSTVDESLTLALYAPTIPDVLINALAGSDITVQKLESEDALKQAVTGGDFAAGIVLPAETITALLQGAETTITVYFASDAPADILDSFRSVLRLAFNELSYRLRGDPMGVVLRESFVGPDLAGQQITARDRLLPLMAILLLVMEMMGLGTLIADEVSKGTLRAVLITPASVAGVFTGKAIFGVTLAFIQGALVMGLTGNLSHEPLSILATLLVGSLVVTGLAFLVASVSRDIMGVLAWSIAIIVIFMIPAYGVVFPGTVTSWIKVVPTYYMFDSIHQIVNLGATWSAIQTNLIVLLLMGIGLLAAGAVVMERKLR